jgi:hypothetical protein
MVRFSCSLTMRPEYCLGDAVVLRAALRHDGAEDLYVLTWGTPLEGPSGDCVDVLFGGERLPYEGPMVKRGDPDDGDYVLVPVGRAVQAELDLTLLYPLAEPGDYEVRPRGVIHDHHPRGPRGSVVAMPRSHHAAAELAGAPARFRLLPGGPPRPTLRAQAFGAAP